MESVIKSNDGAMRGVFLRKLTAYFRSPGFYFMGENFLHVFFLYSS